MPILRKVELSAMDVTEELGPMLEAENAYVWELEDALSKIGESLTDKAREALRMGFRTKALIDIKLNRAQPTDSPAPSPEGAKELTCPFCGDKGFDAIGLKGHLTTPGWCDPYEAVDEAREAERIRNAGR